MTLCGLNGKMRTRRCENVVCDLTTRPSIRKFPGLGKGCGRFLYTWFVGGAPGRAPPNVLNARANILGMKVTKNTRAGTLQGST